MKVLVTGGRNHTSYHDRMWLYAALSLLHGHKPIAEIIEGGAAGFDNHAANWALWRVACGDAIALTTVEAEWERYGLAAGPIRNEKMAEMRPDLVLVCPGGPGTENMMETALKHGLQVVMLEKMPVARGAPAAERPSAPVVGAAA